MLRLLKMVAILQVIIRSILVRDCTCNIHICSVA